LKTRCDSCGRMFGLKRYPDVCTNPLDKQFCSLKCRGTYQSNWERTKAHLKWLYSPP
jgi:predicted nucleic acid-binding Zn ribbon protein